MHRVTSTPTDQRTGRPGWSGLVYLCAAGVVWGTIGPAVDIVHNRSSLSVLGGGSHVESNTDRWVTDGFAVSSAHANYDGGTFFSRAEYGYTFALGGSTTLEPQGGFQYSRLSLDGFTESGAGVLNLVAPDRHGCEPFVDGDRRRLLHRGEDAVRGDDGDRRAGCQERVHGPRLEPPHAVGEVRLAHVPGVPHGGEAVGDVRHAGRGPG